jgi:hypothetical protein
MNGMNQLFTNDPVSFLGRVCVDNKAEQFRTDGLNVADLLALNGAKSGSFDFDSADPNVNIMIATGRTVSIRRVCATHPVVKDTAIQAYWCPFLAGAANQIGWVDVPRRAPQHGFIFTAAMQGCCYVVTNSPASPQCFRVWHNQHPTETASWQTINASGATTVYSQLTYEQYGGDLVNAFNILWRPKGRAWCYVSQSNLFVPSPAPTGLIARMTGADRNYRPTIKLARDKSKPILNLPAGV